MRFRSAAVVLAGSLLLSGCASDVRGELRRTVANITEDANAGDADRVRSGVDELLDQVDDAVRANDIDPAEAARITELARLLKERADLLDPEPSPSPTPVEEPTEEPTQEPTEEPTEEPAPTATRSPTPAPEPSPTPEPTPPPDDDEDEGPLPEVPGTG